MTHVAKGSFEVALTPLKEGATPGAWAPGRMALDKHFHGDLEATSQGEMMTAMSETKGSGGYTAFERVQGALAGRKGAVERPLERDEVFGPHRFSATAEWKPLMKRYLLFYLVPFLMVIGAAVYGISMAVSGCSASSPASSPRSPARPVLRQLPRREARDDRRWAPWRIGPCFPELATSCRSAGLGDRRRRDGGPRRTSARRCCSSPCSW